MKKTILVIDDSAPIRFLLEAMLSKQYAVVSASDGLVALAWLANGNKADCIITDLNMPNIDGWQLLEHLSGSLMYQDIPVIVLSGFNPISLEELASNYSNVIDFIQKPFDPISLSAALEKVFSRQYSAIV